MSEITQKEQCVADATILHYLDQTKLIPPLLDSEVNLVTMPEVLHELEPRYRQVLEERVQAGQVSIEIATTDDMNQLIEEMGSANHMSVTDCLLCRVARRLNTSLLSGCDLLSRNAEMRGVRARSIIWVLNRLVNNGVLKSGAAAKVLGELQHHNPWMNKQRTQHQIEQWQSISRSGTSPESRPNLDLYIA